MGTCSSSSKMFWSSSQFHHAKSTDVGAGTFAGKPSLGPLPYVLVQQLISSTSDQSRGHTTYPARAGQGRAFGSKSSSAHSRPCASWSDKTSPRRSAFRPSFEPTDSESSAPRFGGTTSRPVTSDAGVASRASGSSCSHNRRHNAKLRAHVEEASQVPATMVENPLAPAPQVDIVEPRSPSPLSAQYNRFAPSRRLHQPRTPFR